MFSTYVYASTTYGGNRAGGVGMATTIQAKARIKATLATTIQAKADIKQFGVAQTTTAKARIKNAGVAQTTTAKARIKATLATTIQAKASIWGLADGYYTLRSEMQSYNPSLVNDDFRKMNSEQQLYPKSLDDTRSPS